VWGLGSRACTCASNDGRHVCERPVPEEPSSVPSLFFHLKDGLQSTILGALGLVGIAHLDRDGSGGLRTCILLGKTQREEHDNLVEGFRVERIFLGEFAGFEGLESRIQLVGIEIVKRKRDQEIERWSD